MRRYSNKFNHIRVNIYKVTHNARYHNFLVNPNYINEDELKFVYKENGETIEKVIPTTYWINKSKFGAMWKYDEETMISRKCGYVYYIKEEDIFDY